MGTELVIAGWFASPAIKQLIGLAFSYIKEHPVWLKMKEELVVLHDALQRIQAIVEMVEKLQIINDSTPAQEKWLWQLKDAVDEANDVLDLLEYYKLEEDVRSGGEEVRATTSNYTKKIIRSTAFFFKHAKHLKKKLKRAVKNLEDVDASAGNFLKLHDLSNAHGAMQQQQQIIASRESGCLTEDEVFGRETEKEKIVEWLKKPGSGEHESSVKNVTVLPIVGMAGIGKTTLAQYVYGDGDVSGSFGRPRMWWVCVSKNFHATGVMKKIIRAATRTDPQIEELSTLQQILTENLQSNKFLLVLDDVWNDGDREEWEKLMAPLKTGKQGSKILLTTRMDSVVEMIREVMEGIEEPMNLQGIEWSKYLSLFNKHAFAGVNPDDHKKLQSIGEKIAEKLGQSPLLAKTVGGMLRQESNFNFAFWKEVLENGVFSSIQDHKDFQPILRLSYIHLSPQLQRCFRYCSIFPQDYGFDKDELVRMWMAAGLIQQSEDKKRRIEDIGGEYFDSLLRKSFFNLHRDFKSTYYVIHDLLLEMVCSVSKDECLGVHNSKPKPEDFPATLRHLFIIVDGPFDNMPQLRNLHSLVLRIDGYDHPWEGILNKVLEGSKNLRVLKLQSSRVSHSHRLESLNAIGDLKHLRYLDLDCSVDSTQLSKSVHKLYHLQTIVAPNVYSSIESIREDTRRLINLRHLKLRSEVILTIAEIGKLTSLQELDQFCVGEGNGHRIGALKHLRELRGKLCINNLENVTSYEDAMEAELLYKEYLRNLRLQWGFDSNITPEVAAKVIDGLQPHSSLENLEIDCYSGADPPRWLATQDLNMLESITLTNCKNLKLLPPLEKLPFLKFLSLQNLKALTEVGHSFRMCDIDATAFPSLEVLKFVNIPQLDKWSGVEDGPWFPCLKNLIICNCSRLVALPPLPLSLEQLEISDVGLTTLPRLQQCQNNDCKKSPSPSKLRHLGIESCPKLTSLAKGLLQHTDHFTDVKWLRIIECKELVHLPLEGFQKFISLMNLTIKNCPCLQRHNAAHDDSFLPSSLQTQRLEGFPLLQSPLELPNSLKTLCIHGCDSNLDDLPVSFKELSSLQTLELKGFPLLQSMPELPNSLKTLCIHDCDSKLEDLPVTFKELSSLQTLELKGFPLLQSLPELPNSLKTLCIHDCDSKLEDHLLGQDWNRLPDWYRMKRFSRKQSK